MAKKEGTPGLRAPWLWRWIENGIVEVKPFPGTRMLRVVKAKRIRLPSAAGGQRITLRQGLHLNPRWREPTKQESEEISGLTLSEYAAEGVFRTLKGDFRVLIYQQLKDLSALARQQDYILQYYDGEQEELWRTVAQMEVRAILLAEERGGDPRRLQELIDGRLDEIRVIRTHVAGRKEAAYFDTDFLRRRQTQVRDGLQMVLGELDGWGALPREFLLWLTLDYLPRQHQNLEALLQDQPLVTPTKWAQNYIMWACGAFACGGSSRARDYLSRAIEKLQWPEEA